MCNFCHFDAHHDSDVEADANACDSSAKFMARRSIALRNLGIAFAFLTACGANGEIGKPADQVADVQRKPYALPRSEERFVVAKSGEEFRVLISYPSGPAPAEGYPV